MGAQCHACIGGTAVRDDVQKLQSSTVHVVVGTPGRVHDMINRRALGMYCWTVHSAAFFGPFGFSNFVNILLEEF